MVRLELLTLELHAGIDYQGLENPPLAAIPMAGTVLIPSNQGLMEAGLGMDMKEGEEELFLFDEEDILDFDPDEGPRLRKPLTAPRYYGRRDGGNKAASKAFEAADQGRTADSQAGEAADAVRTDRLEMGSYAFAQWRPKDSLELEEGIEWFLREIWWQRLEKTGPLILRRVREDGALATQLWRRLR